MTCGLIYLGYVIACVIILAFFRGVDSPDNDEYRTSQGQSQSSN